MNFVQTAEMLAHVALDGSNTAVQNLWYFSPAEVAELHWGGICRRN